MVTYRIIRALTPLVPGEDRTVAIAHALAARPAVARVASVVALALALAFVAASPA